MSRKHRRQKQTNKLRKQRKPEPIYGIDFWLYNGTYDLKWLMRGAW